MTLLTASSQPKKRAGKKKAKAAPYMKPPSPHCPLLDLPPELRNNIYEQLCDNSDCNGTSALICFYTPNNLSSKCSLVGGNKQLREEFTSVSSHMDCRPRADSDNLADVTVHCRNHRDCGGRLRFSPRYQIPQRLSEKHFTTLKAKN